MVIPVQVRADGWTYEGTADPKARVEIDEYASYLDTTSTTYQFVGGTYGGTSLADFDFTKLDAATYTVTCTPAKSKADGLNEDLDKASFSFTVTDGSFTVSPKPIADIDFTGVSNNATFTYAAGDDGKHTVTLTNWNDSKAYVDVKASAAGNAENIVDNEDGTYTAQNADTYTIKVELKNKTNYVWATGEAGDKTADKTLTFTINPQQIDINWGTLKFTYSGAEQKPAPKSTNATGIDGESNGITLTATVYSDEACSVSATPIEKGDYFIKVTDFTVSGDLLKANFTLTGVENWKKFVIEAATVAVPTQRADVNLSETYKGEAYTFDGKYIVIPADDENYLQKFDIVVSTTDANVPADAKTILRDVATYKVTFTLKANYSWNVERTDRFVEFEFTITKATIGINWDTVEAEYNASAHEPTATATGLKGSDNGKVNLVVTVEAKTGFALTEGKAVNAGEYILTAALATTGGREFNYKLPESHTHDFVIKKHAIVKPTAYADTLTFNKETQTVAFDFGGTTVVTDWTALGGLLADIQVSATNFEQDVTGSAALNKTTGAFTFVNAGTYTFTLQLTEGAKKNYYWDGTTASTDWGCTMAAYSITLNKDVARKPLTAPVLGENRLLERTGSGLAPTYTEEYIVSLASKYAKGNAINAEIETTDYTNHIERGAYYMRLTFAVQDGDFAVNYQWTVPNDLKGVATLQGLGVSNLYVLEENDTSVVLFYAITKKNLNVQYTISGYTFGANGNGQTFTATDYIKLQESGDYETLTTHVKSTTYEFYKLAENDKEGTKVATGDLEKDFPWNAGNYRVLIRVEFNSEDLETLLYDTKEYDTEETPCRLIVTKLALTEDNIIWTDATHSASVKYDGAEHTLAPTLQNVPTRANDTSSATGITLNVREQNGKTIKNVDTYTIEIVNGGDSDAANNFSYANLTHDLKITKREVTIEANVLYKIYGDALSSTDAEITNNAQLVVDGKWVAWEATPFAGERGFTEKDLATVQLFANKYLRIGLGAFTNIPDASLDNPYQVWFDKLTDTPDKETFWNNYEVTFKKGEFEIRQREITVTVNAAEANSIYGEAVKLGVVKENELTTNTLYTVSGLPDNIPADREAAVFTTYAKIGGDDIDNTSPVDDYAIQYFYDSLNSNYAITFVIETDYTIKHRPLAVTVNMSIYYGEKLPTEYGTQPYKTENGDLYGATMANSTKVIYDFRGIANNAQSDFVPGETRELFKDANFSGSFTYSLPTIPKNTDDNGHYACGFYDITFTPTDLTCGNYTFVTTTTLGGLKIVKLPFTVKVNSGLQTEYQETEPAKEKTDLNTLATGYTIEAVSSSYGLDAIAPMSVLKEETATSAVFTLNTDALGDNGTADVGTYAIKLISAKEYEAYFAFTPTDNETDPKYEIVKGTNTFTENFNYKVDDIGKYTEDNTATAVEFWTYGNYTASGIGGTFVTPETKFNKTSASAAKGSNIMTVTVTKDGGADLLADFTWDGTDVSAVFKKLYEVNKLGAGTYTVTFTMPTAGENYDAIDQERKFIITKASLTVTPKETTGVTTITYGDAKPTNFNNLTVDYDSFMSWETQDTINAIKGEVTAQWQTTYTKAGDRATDKANGIEYKIYIPKANVPVVDNYTLTCGEVELVVNRVQLYLNNTSGSPKAMYNDTGAKSGISYSITNKEELTEYVKGEADKAFDLKTNAILTERGANAKAVTSANIGNTNNVTNDAGTYRVYLVWNTFGDDPISYAVNYEIYCNTSDTSGWWTEYAGVKDVALEDNGNVIDPSHFGIYTIAPRGLSVKVEQGEFADDGNFIKTSNTMYNGLRKGYRFLAVDDGQTSDKVEFNVAYYVSTDTKHETPLKDAPRDVGTYDAVLVPLNNNYTAADISLTVSIEQATLTPTATVWYNKATATNGEDWVEDGNISAKHEYNGAEWKVTYTFSGVADRDAQYINDKKGYAVTYGGESALPKAVKDYALAIVLQTDDIENEDGTTRPSIAHNYVISASYNETLKIEKRIIAAFTDTGVYTAEGAYTGSEQTLSIPQFKNWVDYSGSSVFTITPKAMPIGDNGTKFTDAENSDKLQFAPTLNIATEFGTTEQCDLRATNAGIYTLTISIAAGQTSNYQLGDNNASLRTFTLTISKSNVTVKANDSTVQFGTVISAEGTAIENRFAGFTIEDLGDKASEVDTSKLTYKTTYSHRTNVGTLTGDIEPQGARSYNYAIEYANGDLKVQARVITVSVKGITTDNTYAQGVYTGAYHDDNLNSQLNAHITNFLSVSNWSDAFGGLWTGSNQEACLKDLGVLFTVSNATDCGDYAMQEKKHSDNYTITYEWNDAKYRITKKELLVKVGKSDNTGYDELVQSIDVPYGNTTDGLFTVRYKGWVSTDEGGEFKWSQQIEDKVLKKQVLYTVLKSGTPYESYVSNAGEIFTVSVDTDKLEFKNYSITPVTATLTVIARTIKANDIAAQTYRECAPNTYNNGVSGAQHHAYDTDSDQTLHTNATRIFTESDGTALKNTTAAYLPTWEIAYKDFTVNTSGETVTGAPTKAGTYKATVRLTGNNYRFEGNNVSVEKDFTINKQSRSVRWNTSYLALNTTTPATNVLSGYVDDIMTIDATTGFVRNLNGTSTPVTKTTDTTNPQSDKYYIAADGTLTVWGKELGRYTVTVMFNEAAKRNYTWGDNEFISVEFTVGAEKGSVTVTVDISGWTFNTLAVAPTATSGSDNVTDRTSFAYAKLPSGVSVKDGSLTEQEWTELVGKNALTWSATVPTDAGNYAVRATLLVVTTIEVDGQTQQIQYNAVAYHCFTVEKAEVDAPTNDYGNTNNTYTGERLTLTFTFDTDALVLQFTNATKTQAYATDASTNGYEILFALRDDNYKWKEGVTVDGNNAFVYKWIINPSAANAIGLNNMSEKLREIVYGNPNYAADLTGEATFGNNVVFVYQACNVDAAVPAANTPITDFSGWSYTVPRNAGHYLVCAVSMETSNYNQATRYYKYEIERKELHVTATGDKQYGSTEWHFSYAFTADDFAYNDGARDITVTIDETATSANTSYYVVNDSGETVSGKLSVLGTYYLLLKTNTGSNEIDGMVNPNYKIVLSAERGRFTVTPKPITIQLGSVQTRYHDSAETIMAAKDAMIAAIKLPSGTLAYGDDTIASLGITLNDPVTHDSNAGSYLMTATATNNKNYSVTFYSAYHNVSKMTIRVTITAGGGTYHGTINPSTVASVVDTLTGASLTAEELAEANVQLGYYGDSNGGVGANGFHFTSDDPQSAYPTFAGAYFTCIRSYQDGNYTLVGTPVVAFNIAKQLIDASKIVAPDAVYTGLPQYPTLHDELYGSSVYSYRSESHTDVGTYDVVLHLLDHNNMRWVSVDEPDRTISFKITKGINELTSVIHINGWTYGAYKPLENAAAANVKWGVAQYEYASSQDGLYTTMVPSNSDAGTYWVRVTVPESDNYFAFTSEPVSFVIEKAAVAVPTLRIVTEGEGKNDTFTGSALTAAIAGYVPALMQMRYDGNSSVAGNAVTVFATNAGTYTVTLTLNNSTNYKWSDDATVDKNGNAILTWTIARKKLAMPTTGDNRLVVNGKTLTYLPDGFDAATMGIEGNEIAYGGRFTATVTLLDTDNYEWSDGTTGALSFEWRVVGRNTVFIIVISVLSGLVGVAGITAGVLAIRVRRKRKRQAAEAAAGSGADAGDGTNTGDGANADENSDDATNDESKTQEG